MEMELRVNPSSMVTNDDGSMTVSGYVNRTEHQSELLGSGQKFKEVIKRGAWQKAIDSAKEIHFLAEHDKSKILASTRNGSLSLREDDQGLYMEATISPTSWGKDYHQLIKDGILQNMSFGFRAIKDAWRNVGSHFERTVNELSLFEVSVVRDPAYASSSISARGIDLVTDEVPKSELNLRTIEIRSDEDIEAIAKKLFDMIKANAKEPEPEVETIDEVKGEPEIVEPEVIEETIEEVPAEPVKEEIVEPEPEPEQKEPEPEIIPGADESQKIRDFIKKFEDYK